MTFVTIDEPGREPAPRFALFAYGFRPFFLAAGTYPIITLAAWLGVLEGRWTIGGAAPILWHAHEMVFGFLIAAFAGFLLTAVPNWTQTTRLHGLPLILLFGLWVAGRVAMWLPALPPWAAAVVDCAFLPALAIALAGPIWRRGRTRNGLFVILPFLFTATNLGFHAEMSGRAETALPALHAASGLMLIAVTVIGGRIIPSFTQSGLRMAGNRLVNVPPTPWLDRAALATTAVVATIPVIGLRGSAAAICFAIATLVHAARLSRWQGWRAWRLPLVWVLHLAYLWLVVGFALKAIAALDLAADQAGTHALGAGAMATMALAVMTRATLGHTGRVLRAKRPVTLSYILLTAGAATRVLAVLLPGLPYQAAVTVAGLLWIAGFVLFAIVYAPMLVLRRVDGKPG